MNNPILWMSSHRRVSIIERHQFFVENSKRRIISQFAEFESEFEPLIESEIKKISEMNGRSSDEDGTDIPSRGYDSACNLFSLLTDFKNQITAAVFAGCYHFWERELRSFLEDEISRIASGDVTEKYAWNSKTADLFEILTELGWDIKTKSFYRNLNASGLAVNVYKHGNGVSQKRLLNNHPEYFGRVSKLELGGLKSDRGHNELEITEAHYEKLATSVLEFWSIFPERLGNS